MRSLIGVLIVAVSVICHSAIADELFKYNYVEAGYTKSKIDANGYSSKPDHSSYGVDVSYAVHEYVELVSLTAKDNPALMAATLGCLFHIVTPEMLWLQM